MKDIDENWSLGEVATLANPTVMNLIGLGLNSQNLD
jgi:hypothetical protein